MFKVNNKKTMVSFWWLLLKDLKEWLQFAIFPVSKIESQTQDASAFHLLIPVKLD